MTRSLRPERDEMSHAIPERTLSDALRTLPLVEEARERIRVAVACEWRATKKASVDTPIQSRRVRWVALATAVGVVAVTAALLADGGMLRIAPDTVIDVTSATRFELQRGMLYVD